MKSLRLTSQLGRMACVLVFSLAVSCTPRPPLGRTTDAPACDGTRTIVVHNGTASSVEVVLSDDPLSLGTVVAVLQSGQQSHAIRRNPSGPYLVVRDQATGRRLDWRHEQRLRLEFGCESGS